MWFSLSLDESSGRGAGLMLWRWFGSIFFIKCMAGWYDFFPKQCHSIVKSGCATAARSSSLVLWAKDSVSRGTPIWGLWAPRAAYIMEVRSYSRNYDSRLWSTFSIVYLANSTRNLIESTNIRKISCTDSLVHLKSFINMHC